MCLDSLSTDCSQKCLYLERTSRHGAGAPPSCSLCDQACPSNVLSTITDLTQAIWEDVLTVVRMVATCFGNHGAYAHILTDLPIQVLTLFMFTFQVSRAASASL